MRHLIQGTLPRPSTRPALAPTIARRTLGSLNRACHTTGLSDPRGAEEEITSYFTGDRTAPEAGEHPHQRRRRGKGEADTLLSDIVALGKKVADEQRRGRVSIPASRLRSVSLKTRAPLDGASRAAASSPQPAGGSPDAKELITLPPLTPPAPVVSAAMRERPVALPPASSLPRETVLPPLQSWTPAFVLTPQELRAISDAHGASDIAFTLEELEATLFSHVSEQTEGDANVATAEALVSVSTPPPPPPSAAPAMPCSRAPLEPIEAPPTIAVGGAAAPPLAQAAISSGQPLEARTTGSPIAHAAASLPTALDAAAAFPLTSLAPTPSERNASLEGHFARTAHAAPVLRCRLRGSAVEVSMSRPSQSPRELLEALHEAISFAESLPALPQGPRLVRLGVDSTSTACASYSFIEPEGWTEVTSGVEERVAAQLLKERLLQRIAEGPLLGLRYIAELRTADFEAPLVIRNMAAELLLACTPHDVRVSARSGVLLKGTTDCDLRLSFSGIGVGVFPAPSTLLRLARAVTAMCDREAERSLLLQALARASGRSVSAAAAPKLVGIVSEVARFLHTLPLSVSAALLRDGAGSQGGAREGAAEAACNGRVKKAYWFDAAWPKVRRWWKSLQGSRDEAGSACGEAPIVCAVRMSSCVTAYEVWRCLCEALLSPATDEVSTRQAISDAIDSAPVRRCRQSYLAVASSVSVHRNTSSPFLPAVVVDVTASSLQRTSVADLASEISEQPADVVLALSEDVQLPQKLQFLASLHLPDSGSHHCVTVLLPGDPAAVAECVSLTRSSAHLASQSSCYQAGPSKVHPCDPYWLHQLIEVSNARTSTVVSGGSPGPHGLAPASLGELYAAHAWHRPCVTTRTSIVGLEMSAAVAVSWQRLIAGATGRGQRKALVEQFQRTQLAPLVLLRPQSGGEGCDCAGPAWWTTNDGASTTQQYVSVPSTMPRLMKSLNASWPAPSSTSGLPSLTGRSICVAHCGVAFLFALDVACQSLLRRTIESPEQLNVLSIAALGLDTSAGGLVEVADRVAGGGVEIIVSAMEDAATVHGVRFASLPLLRWMADNRLLFYQLTPQRVDRYITCSQERVG
ncbi:hypothetical protein LSCM1_00658 [Leishmania martiniquensis]|uniref:Uncharacterized protein n=1 Tax=Leishmania martiniquensis TaxID=1580590 RepID=A0A836G367_9TRYP|nr:hypothetical protein LSCM1_00658 [Leishmania martiniquensis]